MTDPRYYRPGQYPGDLRYTQFPVPAYPRAKSRIVAGVLGLFLGWCGVHRFYLGFTGVGIAQIIVTVCTLGVGGIWGFVEGILYLVGALTVDAEGRPLRD